MTRVLDALLLTAGRLLYRLRLHRLVMWLNAGAPKVLVYHACEERESSFLRGLDSNTTPAELAQHLDFLRRFYSVVPLEALSRTDLPRRAVAITFDDGYRSVYKNAFPLLKQFDVPATVFLVSSAVDNERLVWVNELTWFLHEHPTIARHALASWLTIGRSADVPAIIHSAKLHFDAEAIERTIESAAAEAHVSRYELARRAELFLDWRHVEEMSRRRVSFGSHTATHANLTRLSRASLRRELAVAQEAVRQRLGACSALAYPFGAWNEEAFATAVELGHEIIAEIGGDNARLDLRHVGRVPVRARDDATLFAELEVAAPIRALARRVLRPRSATRTPSSTASPTTIEV